jgi:hypothetical protein
MGVLTVKKEQKQQQMNNITTAADVMKSGHPANSHFLKWVESQGKEPTRRKARLFLSTFPQYKQPIEK